MKIIVTNQQTIRRPNIHRIRALTRFFMNQVCRLGRRHDWGDLSLVLADDTGMARINRLYLNQEAVTDVISFISPPLPGQTRRFGGEIFVNIQRAVIEGAKRKGVDTELALYIAHGCDHLSGQHDRSQSGRRCMRRRELRWLKKAKELKLAHDLLEEKP